jgi:hypothetical protein
MILYLYTRVCEEFNFIVCSPGFSLDRRVVVTCTGVNIRDRGDKRKGKRPELNIVPPKILFRNSTNTV